MKWPDAEKERFSKHDPMSRKAQINSGFLVLSLLGAIPSAQVNAQASTSNYVIPETSDDVQNAAYAEVIIYLKLGDIPKLDELCDAYLTKYPTAENAELLAIEVGGAFLRGEDWGKVRTFYTRLIKDFPKSESIDRYKFFIGLSYHMDEDYNQAHRIFDAFAKEYPESDLVEIACYHGAMSRILANDQKAASEAIETDLSHYPEGRFRGDLRYRLAFINFNDKEVDQSDKLIRDLDDFISQHPKDGMVMAMLRLIGDTYTRKKSLNRGEKAKFEKLAVDSYIKAAELLNDDRA
jgi:outer membrane protein assembly factor BamD (BamD/ComL family)